MGYIAPITNYQYEQYAERTVMKRYNPYQFVPISTIKAPVNPREYDEQNETAFFRRRSHKMTPPIKPSEKVIEQIYSEVTGTGSLYNESV